MRTEALRFKSEGRVEAVGKIHDGPKSLFWLSQWLSVPVPEMENTCRGIEVPAESGEVFTVTLGDGCEPLRLGLCRYAERVRDPETGRWLNTRRRGWQLAGCCKTQYASVHGWPHFHRCHTAAIELLAGLDRKSVV